MSECEYTNYASILDALCNEIEEAEREKAETSKQKQKVRVNGYV